MENQEHGNTSTEDEAYDHEYTPKPNDYHANTSTEDEASGHEYTGKPTEKNGDSSGRLFRIFKLILIPFAILGLIGFLLIYFLSGTHSVPEPLDGIPGLALFNKENLAQEEMWLQATGQGGLALTVINALDQEWYPYFDLAVQQWDNGTPDALTLATQVSSPDPSCSFVTGFLKICNGDYGGTNYYGINQVVMNNGKIESSIGKMNQHYFGKNDGDLRQYTMCHEMGHGFGLPHTDEIMWNRGTGNCLDYTNHPKNNKVPGTINYERLATLYGTVGGNGTWTGSTTGNRKLSSKAKNARHRNLLRNARVVHESNFPESVLKAIDSINARVDNGLVGSHADGWRMLAESRHGGAHEIDLGSGYTMKIHYLLATDSDSEK